MRILFIGDIHYPREGELFSKFLDLISSDDFDYIVIHKKSSAKVIAVMGNHDFWLSNTAKKRGHSSWDLIHIYRSIFRSFRDFLLWDRIYVVDDIAFVGVPGWYDYRFAAWHLGINRKMLDQGYYLGSQ